MQPKLNMGCAPPQQPTFAQNADGSMADPCAYLASLRASLATYLSGGMTKLVRFQDQWLERQNVNVSELRKEIRRAEILCGAATSGGARAIRAGPYIPVSAPYGLHRYR